MLWQNSQIQSLGDIVRIPDSWQTEAYEHLKAGRDVVIDAPTGAGKTYVFEMLIERGFSGRVVYTVHKSLSKRQI